MIKRVKKAYPRRDSKSRDADSQGDAKTNGNAKRGISSKDYEMVFKFFQNINDVDLALKFFKYGQEIDKATLKHAANTVAHVQLRDHLIDVIFTLFDEDRKYQIFFVPNFGERLLIAIFFSFLRKMDASVIVNSYW